MRPMTLMLLLLLSLFAPLCTPLAAPLSDAPHAQQSNEANLTDVTPSSGWTTGGEEITITGEGFLDMAFKNVTSDGEPYTWTTSTINYVTGAGYSPSVVVDSNGTVHIVHVLWKDHELWHSKLTAGSSSWSHTKIMDCNGCRETDMTIDSNDNIHLAFYLQQTGTTGYLYYGVYNGTTWATQSLQSNVYNNQIRIVLDAHDRPHISYANAGYICNGAMLKYYDGSTWLTQAIDTTTTYVGCDTTIAIDQNGHVHVAYRHHSNMDLMIGSNVSGTWQRFTIDNGNDVGYHNDMVVDHDNNLQILYRTNAAGGQYKHATGMSASAWSTTSSSGGLGEFRMQTDGLGNIHASAYDSGSDDMMYQLLVSGSGNQWNLSTVDSVGNVGYENDIFVDDNNMIHIAYYDSTNERLKYANKSSGMYLKQEITVDFGPYGQVTGTVVNDTTIVVTTPTAGSIADSINLSLWGEDGNEHVLGLSFQFISPDDVDMDGVLNVEDGCPDVAGNSTVDREGCPDGDGDGYSDDNDAFPTNSAEWFDMDFDGVGDNSDVFPNDTSEWMDSDGDGVGDNGDAFPFDANETMDSDNDGYGDNTDMFPFNAFEHLDSDGDGAGDNADAFPFDPNETMDSDGDGLGDNADAFPNDASETMDSDGDGIGDNSDSHPFVHNFLDSDGDSVPDLIDDFPSDHTQGVDSDGDGYGDNASGVDPDAFPTLPTQWSDIDGDGFGDNWGNASWNSTRAASGIGRYVPGAVLSDYCPEVAGNSSSNGYFGCIDDDGDGVPNMFEVNDDVFDADGDLVLDEDDECPNTAPGAVVDFRGCEVRVADGSDANAMAEDGFLAGEVAQRVGLAAVLLAVVSFLQTNAAAAMLPDAFRWVQVFRRGTKMSQEEVNELTYLQSLVQAFAQETEHLHDELRHHRADISARYANNEISRETREKLTTMIDDLLERGSAELQIIAENDAWFGLSATVDAAERRSMLETRIAFVRSETVDLASEPAIGFPLDNAGDEASKPHDSL